jgi:hypothetical protein
MNQRERAQRSRRATTAVRPDLRGPRGDVERAQRAERLRGVQGRGQDRQEERTLTERTWTRGEPVDAMQTALAAEHAAIWGYGVVGARVAADLRGQVREADSAHRARRDVTAATVRTLGGDPAPTHASYQLPFRVTDQPSALRLAVHLEQGVAAA